MKKAGHAVKKIQTVEKASEDLRVVTVNPFTAKLESVFAMNDTEVIANIGPPEKLIDSRFKEKGLSKAKNIRRGSGADGRVGHARRIGRIARPIFSRIGKMRLVEHIGGDSAEPVRVYSLDLRWSFNAVSCCSIRGHIKGLIRNNS